MILHNKVFPVGIYITIIIWVIFWVLLIFNTISNADQPELEVSKPECYPFAKENRELNYEKSHNQIYIRPADRLGRHFKV